MELFEKKNSKYYWYDFTVRGKRYRGSTKQTIRVQSRQQIGEGPKVCSVE